MTERNKAYILGSNIKSKYIKVPISYSARFEMHRYTEKECVRNTNKNVYILGKKHLYIIY